MNAFVPEAVGAAEGPAVRSAALGMGLAIRGRLDDRKDSPIYDFSVQMLVRRMHHIYKTKRIPSAWLRVSAAR